MINKISFYCYLFIEPFDSIVRYDILWKKGEKYLLKHSQLNRHYKNESQQISATVFDALPDAISAVVLQLRELEIKNGIYKDVQVGDPLNEKCMTLVREIQQAIPHGLKTFSMFGHVGKYEPQAPATSFVKAMGYFLLTTKKPLVYVLDDFLKNENKSVIH